MQAKVIAKSADNQGVRIRMLDSAGVARGLRIKTLFSSDLLAGRQDGKP
jgi:hypothetical protein